MKNIKKIADFQDHFFKIARKKSKELLKLDIEKEVKSGKDFPVSLEVDFSLLVDEINALKLTKDLFSATAEELKSDLNNLFNSKNYDDFINNFEAFVEINELKGLPDALRGIIHMEVGLALSFVTVLNNLDGFKMEDYENSFYQYFFSSKGYKTVSGDLIVRPKLPNINNLAEINKVGNQINAERYIRDMTRIVIETTGDGLYNLRDRYAELTKRYQDKKKLIEWFDSFGDLAEASILPVVESFINGAFGIELNPLIAAAIGIFCSVTTRKATEHSYLTLLGIQ